MSLTTDVHQNTLEILNGKYIINDVRSCEYKINNFITFEIIF